MAGRTLADWYDHFLAKVPGPVEHREVPTPHGPSHVLLAGDPSRPPLVCVHPMRTSSAHVLSLMGPLLERFRLVAPDVPGESVRGPQVRLPVNDDAHGRWLVAVLDGLGLDRCDLFGISWGGFVARQAATVAPGRVRRLVLMVPAGVVPSPLWKGLARMAVPMLLYRLWPTEARLRRLLAPLMTTWDDDWGHFMADVLRGGGLRIPPPATDAELRSLAVPTLVLAADDDISFPGPALLARMRALVPHVETDLIADCKHCPPTTPEFRAWMADRVTAFLNADGG